MARPLIMDVDTGVDDAMALALATALPEHDLVAVTTVAGNVSIDKATANTLRMLNWIGVHVPVYRGMSQPLARPHYTATDVHGDDGLGGWQEPEVWGNSETMSAPEAIIRFAQQHQGEIDGVFVGPLTNLAVALALEPELAGWFRHMTIMGGSFFSRGNVTPAAEFNLFVDPEAAAAVARSGMACTWIGLDVTHQVSVSKEMWKRLAGATDPVPVLVREVCRRTIETRSLEKVHLHDPLAVAVGAYPEIVGVREGQVRVDVGEVLRGETRLIEGTGAAKVAASVDTVRFLDIFHSALGFSSM